jgi:two-component system, NtrC family, nitrogen regulation sensor histidine kinase NtrY
MSLRTKLTLYLVLLHLGLGALVVPFLLKDPEILFGVEAVFFLSILLSVRYVRALFVPLDLTRTAKELIEERDFTSRFVPVGQPEMDSLIDVFNRMVDRLREERLAAEEQHQLLEKIVEASPAGIVICDFDGEIERMNPSARRLMDDDLWSQLRVLTAGESRLMTDRGSRRLRVARAEFRDRGFLKSFYVIEEMTEELRLTEKAAYEKLIRMMSHEVNNSVGAVRSLLESLLAYAPQVGDADRDDFTNALKVASARMDALNRFMGAFADVVRIPPPRRAPVSLAKVVELVAALVRPEAQGRGIAIALQLDDRRTYELDESQLEQVLLNIFRNAIEAIGRDGAITATLTDGVLSIADNGPGIADSARTELFTPFFTTKRDGRGLGLTIVQEILANHGFLFSLGNREGGGAEFRIVVRS